METEYVLEIDTIISCRICNSLRGVHNILEDKLGNEGVLVHEALEFVACHKVDPDDSLSKFLCESCLKRLLDAYTFKNQILDTYRHLDGGTTIIIKGTDLSSIDSPSLSSLNVEIIPADSVETFGLPESQGDGEMSTDAVEFFTQHYTKNQEQIEIIDACNGNFLKNLENSTRSENGTYECQFCDKAFRCKSNYIDHIRLHANVKKFVCNYCGKAFVQIGNYRMHLRIHTNERPFSCSLCQKSFNQSGSLKVHLRSHYQERNYVCTVCKKAFKSSSDLCKHRKVHDPSLQYKCEQCGKCFAQKVNMRRHQDRRHSKD